MTFPAGSDRFVVLTGGPGAGKTTLLDALAAAGLAVSPEAGRAVIRREVASGGRAVPWIDPLAFADRMLDLDRIAWRDAAERRGPVVFDRGCPDIIGYLRLSDQPVPDVVDRAARDLRYGLVFVLPPWPEIYRQDSERLQDAAGAERTCRMMERVYPEYGYAPRIVPRGSVSDRVAFVLAALDEAGLRPAN